MRALEISGQLLLEIPIAIALTLVAARLLGVRRSWVAIAAAGVIGWVAANLVVLVLRRWDWDGASVSVRVVALMLLFTMLAAVGIDFVARPGTLAQGERAGLLVVPHPFRDVRRRLELFARYREILRIARRNGLTVGASRRRDRLLERSVSVGLRKTLEESGTLFVKLGQMASTRDDLLPAELTTELRRLQSRVEPAPREAMQELLEAELAEPVETFFTEFDWTPIGSASIAQAYVARLKTGEEVIVKVQRPDMDELVARDSTVLLHLARMMEQRTPIGKDLHALELADEFVRGLFDELDFVLEGANAVDIGLATADTTGVRIPHVHTALVTRRVLVEERLRGTSVADRERIAELGLDPAEIADRLVRAMVDQLMHGHFHADPHPGNVLLLDDGSIGFIDFGMTGRLDASQRAALLQITLSASQGDAAGLRDGIQQVAVVGADVSDIELERALARFISLHLRPGTNIGAQAMSELIPLLSTFDIHMPREMTMCLRALAMLDGTVHAVDPGYSLIAGMQRLIGGTTVSEAATGEIGDQLRDELIRELPRLRRIPSHLERIASLTARGDLRTRVSLFSSVEDARVVTTLANRMILALAGSLLVVGSAISLALTSAASDSRATSLAEVFGVLGASIGIVLVLRVVAAVVRDGYQ